MADVNFGGSVNGASIGTADISHESAAGQTSKLKRKGSTLKSITKPLTIIPKVDEAKALELIKMELNIRHSFGSTLIENDGIQCYNIGRNERDANDRLIYKVGRQLCLYTPETNEEKFISDRKKNITDVLHFSISSNNKYLSVCETLKTDHDDMIPHGRVSVYSLSTLQLLKQLVGPNEEEFISSMFCGDPKMIAGYTNGESEKLVVIWQWEKERIYKTHLFTIPLSRIRCAPSSTLMLTTTGPNHIKVWFLGSDGLFKSGNLLPAAKENENFIDHIWLPSSGSVHKMIALVGHDSKTTSSTVMARQTIQIFEGGDAAQGHIINAPISLDLRQTEIMKVDGINGVVATALVSSQKGFALVGANGFVVIFERADDRKYPYGETRRFRIGSEHIICGALSISESHMYVVSNTKRLLYVPIEVKPMEESSSKTDDGSSTEAADKDLELFKLSGATELQRGFHLQPILCGDIARGRPLLATISLDQSCRIWNYDTLNCDLIHYFRGDEPLTLSMHPSGFQLLVSFKDRVKVFNILVDRLQEYQEVILKNCKEAKFSNGGQYFAAVSSININVYDTTSGVQVASFQGHTMTVRRLCWAPGDQVIFSSGMDGNVYGWPVAQEGRLDILSNSRGSAVIDMIVDSGSTSFPKNDHVDEEGEGITLDQFQSQSRTLVLASMDGHMKIPEWGLDVRRETRGTVKEPHLILGEERFAITALSLSSKRDLLYAGTKSGSVRVYAWPPTGEAATGAYLEYHIHNAPVVSIKESPIGNTIVSVGEDGSIFVFNTIKIGEKEVEKKNEDELLLEDELTFNNSVVMLSVEQMEESIQAIVDLKKQLHETHQKHSFQEHRRESEFADQLRTVVDKHENFFANEKSKFEKERSTLEGKIRDLFIKIENAETEQVKIRAEVENRYEHRLAEQLDRYDRLSEEMELLKQKCEGLVRAEREAFTKQLNDLKNDARLREKKLRTENRRITDERQSDETSFKEILDQQEDEYEDELKQLISAAELELVSERETISKLRTLVQTKNTKIDQLKKKLIELSQASKARLMLLNNERNEKQKLLNTIEHYKNNLKERETALDEKEKIILELRSTTRTLENFRFVLDHRLQQLSAERGPITAHIEGLEKHISTMYEELVEEFEQKTSTQHSISSKDTKIQILTQELQKIRNVALKREQTLNAFKRELGNIVASAAVGKELEESIILLHRKHVKGEIVHSTVASNKVKEKMEELMYGSDDHSVASGPVKGAPSAGTMNKVQVAIIEDALVDAAREAERQRGFMEKESKQTKQRLETVKDESLRGQRSRILENSYLIVQCNSLRQSVKDYDRQMLLKNSEIFELNTTISNLKDANKNLTDTLKMTDSFKKTDTLKSQVTAKQQVDETKDAADSRPLPDVNQPKFGIQKAESTGALNVKLGESGVSIRSEGSLHSLHGKGVPPKRKTGIIDDYDKPGAIKFKKKTPAERSAERLSAENEVLMKQLDESYREKEMQRLELGRLRKAINKLTFEKGNNNVHGNIGVVLGSRSTAFADDETATLVYNSIKNDMINRSLTSADSRGIPNSSDVDDLALGPAPSIQSRGQSRAEHSRGNPLSKSNSQKEVSLPGVTADISLSSDIIE